MPERGLKAISFRAIGYAVAILLGLYTTAMGFMYTQQRNMIYLLDPTSPGSIADVVPGAENITVRTSDNLTLNTWVLPPSGPDRGMAVLYLPGNGGNRVLRIPVGTAIADQGFTVLLLDYRGAGGNPGSPTEEALNKDAHAGLDALHDMGFTQDKIIYFGESLGTGVASRLVSEQPPAGVVLRSPFTSLDDVAKDVFPLIPSFLVKDHYRSDDWLRNSDVPVRILYGTSDTLVLPTRSEELANTVGNLQGLVAFEGADHNSPIWSAPRMGEETAALAEDL